MLFLLGKVASFLEQRLYFRSVPERMAAPDQMEPDLEIEKILILEQSFCMGQGLQRTVQPPLFQKLSVPRTGGYHGVRIGLEKMLQQLEMKFKNLVRMLL